MLLSAALNNYDWNKHGVIGAKREAVMCPLILVTFFQASPGI